MGQIISTADLKKVVDSNVKSYVEQVTGPYSRLLSRSPTFVTYYSQDVVNSTADVNLGGVIEFAGPESPIKYSTVRDFPIYGISEADVSSSYDETRGIVMDNVGGEAIILPGTLDPMENDFFVIQHLDTLLAFRVKQVDVDRIEGNAYHKIQYFLDTLDVRDLEKQVTNRNAFEIRNLGTDMAPIVREDVALVLRELDAVCGQVRIAYWRAFYDRSSGTLMLRDGEFAVHDRALDEFVRRTNVLSEWGYMGARHIGRVDYNDRGLFEDEVYWSTLYAWAEDGKRPIEPLRYGAKLAPARPVSESSPFFADYATTGYRESIPLPDGPGVDVLGWGPELGAVLDSGDLSSLSGVRLLVARCLTGHYRDGSYDKTREFVDAMNDRSILLDRNAFFRYGPILLREAQRMAEAAQRTNP